MGSFSLRQGCLFFSPVDVPEAFTSKVPPSWRAPREARDGPLYHITVVTPVEEDGVMAATLLLENDQINPLVSESTPYYCIGLVKTEEVCFAPVLFPFGQHVRIQCGLGEREGLHITLGFAKQDRHDIDKSFKALKGNLKNLYTKEVDRFLKDCLRFLERSGGNNTHTHSDLPPPPFEELDDVSRAFIKYLYEVLSYTTAEELFRVYLILFCRNRKERCDVLYAMVAAGHVGAGLTALLRLQEDPDHLFTLLNDTAINNGNGTIAHCTRKQAETLATFYNSHRPVAKSKRFAVVEAKTDEVAEVKLVVSPANFGEIKTDHPYGFQLYGSGIVQSKHLPLLQKLSITTILNLMEESGSSLKSEKGIHYNHIPIEDRSPPSEEELERILILLNPGERGGNVVVHCLGGKGRTAFVLLSYLMKRFGMSLAEGFAALDTTGRETLLSDSQKDALRKIEEGLHKETAEVAVAAEEGEGEGEDVHHAEANPSKKLPYDAIILCGLPGSGKSTLGKHIAAHCSRVVRISQDELGRKEAEKRLSVLRSTDVALVDRCNLTPEDRKAWRPARAQRVLCIFMDIPAEVAIYRVKHRADHETLRPTSAERVVKELKEKLIPPSAEKEEFCDVITLSSEEAVSELVVGRWGLPPLEPPPLDTPDIVKFPRTRHLMNLGAATRDDLILEQRDVEGFLHTPIYVEEKIDGANFGISIDPVSYQILCQNRSHIVSSGYHAQFGRLTPWLTEHSAELYQLLIPGREVLYGEWLVAQHSIHYTNLPDYFVAFDLFDKFTNTFASRPVVEQRLQECTTIPLIRLISHREFNHKEELAALVNTPSVYYDGKVEGCTSDGAKAIEQWIARKLFDLTLLQAMITGQRNRWW